MSTISSVEAAGAAFLAADIMKATGTKEEMTQLANGYANTFGMNELNRKGLVTLKTEGKEAFIKAVFTDPTDSSKQLSYSEMRSLYG